MFIGFSDSTLFLRWAVQVSEYLVFFGLIRCCSCKTLEFYLLPPFVSSVPSVSLSLLVLHLLCCPPHRWNCIQYITYSVECQQLFSTFSVEIKKEPRPATPASRDSLCEGHEASPTTRYFIRKLCPMYIRFGLLILFKDASFATVVLYFFAIPLRVSPLLTV